MLHVLVFVLFLGTAVSESPRNESCSATVGGKFYDLKPLDGAFTSVIKVVYTNRDQ